MIYHRCLFPFPFPFFLFIKEESKRYLSVHFRKSGQNSRKLVHRERNAKSRLIYSGCERKRERERERDGDERKKMKDGRDSLIKASLLGLFSTVSSLISTLFQRPTTSFSASPCFIERTSYTPQHRWCPSFAAAFSLGLPRLAFLRDIEESRPTTLFFSSRGSEVLMRQTRDDGVENGIESLWNASFLTPSLPSFPPSFPVDGNSRAIRFGKLGHVLYRRTSSSYPQRS